ncbi:MAG: glycoside hydrolase family 3 protein [Treponemataceae bacterium]|nr:glycoside hydrolase family 3 protein [Treponemataceae bacterium]
MHLSGSVPALVRTLLKSCLKQKYRTSIISIFAFLFFFSSIFNANAQSSVILYSDGYPADLNFWSDYPDDELAEAIVNRMTDEELLAQILMFGWSGSEPSNNLYQWVKERGLGSVKLYGWNTDNIYKVAESVSSLQQRSVECRFKIPLFVATDQEGGWIRHVKGETSDTPGNLAIGASGYPYDAYYSGYYIGRELNAMGINMNFAPIVDIYSSLKSMVIGPRSFGDDPDYVGTMGVSFSQGLFDAGVIPTAKHFPGHGDTDADSHGKLPVINISKETFYNRELVPFKAIIAAGFPAIMSGHLCFPQIEPDGTPASLSKRYIKSILREELGYNGLVITDDMMMNAATVFAGGVSLAVRMAIKAGNDIIIFSDTPDMNDAIWRNNYPLMNSDPEFRGCVKEAAIHILKEKLKYFKSGNAAPLFPDVNNLAERIPDPEGSKFFLEQACRSISLYKGDSFPYTPEQAQNERVLIAGPFITYQSELKKRYKNAELFYYRYTMDSDQLATSSEDLLRMVRRYDTSIIIVGNEETAAIANSLKNCGKKIIIISVLSPNFVIDMDWADTILFAYSYSDYSFKAVAAVLSGEIPVYGKIPLSLPEKE